MTDAERLRLIDLLAATPDAGERIVGSGGCRKVRFARTGGGKSGGYRVVTVFGGRHMPVYLIAVLSKGSRANFSNREVATMAELSKRLLAAHRPGRPLHRDL